MKWVKDHWAMITWGIVAFFAFTGSLIAVGTEYGQYQDVKEAVTEQKAFNEDFRSIVNTMEIEQAVIRTQTTNIEKLLLEIKQDLKDK